MLDIIEVYQAIQNQTFTLEQFEEWVSEQRTDASEYLEQLISEQ
ncbi:MAG: hypothetical protein WC679_02535 [Bacteroidales bacterium]|jgi:hypothetical protein